MADLLDIQDLRKSFGALRVTDGVWLTIAAGEIHALIGPNGAGKTSLIHQISGFLRPDAGRIRLAGEDITHLPPHRRARRGLIRNFQITAILPEFSALENAALAVQARAGHSLRLFGRADRDAQANRTALAALDRMGLADRAGHAAGTLSYGEKRQLELAMALAADPLLLLLDEPLAGSSLDEAARLIGLLRGLKGQCTILLVEHDMEAVFALADTLTVLAEGRVLASGAPLAVRADPAVRAAYLGDEG